MKKMRNRVSAFCLVAFMALNALAFGPIQANAATTYTATTEAELLEALSNANDGDVINVEYGSDYMPLYLNAPIEITKDVTINIYGYIEYMPQNTEELAEAILVINNCDVTIAGQNQFATPNNGVYSYKLMDENGNASLTIDSSGMLDEGILIVDDASNSYSSKLTINRGSYRIPTDRITAIAFSNGTENTAVPKANLVINGGEFQEDFSAYVGENTILIDNGEDAWCRYEVRSTVMSDHFERMLTDGKIIVPSAEPEDEDAEYAYLMGYLCMFETADVCYYPERISDGVYDIAGWMQQEPYDMTEEHRVEVVFDADLDSKASAVAKSVVENLPREISWSWMDEEGVEHNEYYSPFIITDLELVNMWLTGYDRDNLVSHRHTVNYSSELKEYLANTNVDFRVTMIGAGLDTDLYNEACGEAVVLINDIMYAAAPQSVYAQVEHIIYVPDGTATDKDSLMAAAQTRVNEYVGSDSKVEIIYGGAYNTLSNTWWNEDDAAYQAEMMEYLGLETAPEHYFVATSGDMQYKFLIMADSSKMMELSYKTVDASSNVVISSDSAEIPLDTSMRANQLTGGDEYDKVMDALDVEENVTFDLKLYSQSTESYVSKLESGTFEVQIPITEELTNKDLVAYYVDENGRVVEYEVTVKDGNAVFSTDHFSIYTIAEKKAASEPVQPEVEVVAPETNVGGSTFEEKAETVVEKVPFTEEEQAQIEAGAEVTITLEVKDITETVEAEDKALVEKEVAEVKDQKVGMYLDVNMFKQVGDNAAVKVPELDGKVKIQFTVPEDLLVKDTTMNRLYSIIRIHDGETTVIDAKFDPTTKTLVFETDCFSTYALVYKDVAKTPATSDNTSIAVWMLLLAAGSAIALRGVKRRNYI